MASESEKKIRRVAIVLQSMDSATARKLLAQFPENVGRDIRRAMANLGTIPPSERAEAMAELQGLMGIAPPASPNATSPTNAQSPAFQLLSHGSSTQDSLQLSPQAIQAGGSESSATQFAPHSTTQATLANSQPENDPWADISPALIAELLEHERAIVIATVTNHLPVGLATSVLQQLSVRAATEAMAVLPNLHHTDSILLQEILEEMRTKIFHATRAQQYNHAGLDRLRAITANVPSDQRGVWARALDQHDPKLAAQLGWQETPPTTNHSDTSTTLSSREHGKNPGKDVEVQAISAVLEDHTRTENPARPFRSWHDLLRLEDLDFVRVLHAMEPDLVLLALANADRKLLARFERLIPKKEVPRFRARLNQLSDVSLREIDQARDAILDKAAYMAADGTIAPIHSLNNDRFAWPQY